MLSFKPITRRDAARLRRYYETCNYELCEYSLGTKLMWRNWLNPSWTEVAGCLVVRNNRNGKIVYDYPVPGPEGDEDAALSAIEAECLAAGIAPAITVVPECKAPRLLQRYPYAQVRNVRTWRDYLYYREDLQLFAGRRYSGQRNHIRKFRANCPNAVFRPLLAADREAVERFWTDYEAEFPKGDNQTARNELRYARQMLTMAGRPWFLTGGIFDRDRLIALSMAEKCGETMIIHVEKALYSYPGVYPALVQEFVTAFGEGCRYINREDDAADKGLRASKTQYGPVRLAPKFAFEPRNELLQHVSEIPILTTERLTLTPIREEDIPAYNALVLDQWRNRWWGYDDVGGLHGPVEERSFFEVAERDFANRLAVNFAVRLEGKFIGEAVLYNFDFRGGAELGCRICKAYDGHGYGTEAFAAAADWGLYKVHLSRVFAKCFRENRASFKMLSSCMKRIREDETFFYFEKYM